MVYGSNNINLWHYERATTRIGPRRILEGVEQRRDDGAYAYLNPGLTKRKIAY